MDHGNDKILTFLQKQLRMFRKEADLTREQIEKDLILGPGWLEHMETGKIVPSLDVVLTLLSKYSKTLSDLLPGPQNTAPQIKRSIFAEKLNNGIAINFSYAKYDAIYELPNASLEQYNEIVLSLRNGLARLARKNIDEDEEKSIKTESVTNAFLKAAGLWPKANPSDIWWFIIYRAYCDQYNHPAVHSRLNFEQSWKRTGGWALERILEKHYAPKLEKYGVNLFIGNSKRKEQLLCGIEIGRRMESDKIDVMLTVGKGASEKFIGVVHVKASMAERRTDDVPMSEALVDAGYISPLWTMDCKSSPAKNPVNRGEFGAPFDGTGKDERSAKRKDIEDGTSFSACFSYNKNTLPTPGDCSAAKAKIHVCDFSNNEEDAFVKFIVSESERIRQKFHL